MSEERQAKRLKTAPTSAVDKSVEIPGVKDLASSDPTIRRNCLQSVLQHLDTRPATACLTKTQSLQLWRGFYVALYMHDSKNMVSVQNVISTLASTFETIASKDEELIQAKSTTEGEDEGSSATNSEKAGARWKWLEVWSEAFWETISREWSGIDSHRLNKYLLLVRVVVRQLVAICVEAIVKEFPRPSSSPIESQNHILESWPLSPRERKVPDGLRLHVLDVWVDEMDTSGFSKLPEDEEQKVAVLGGLERLMDPVRGMAKDALNKDVRMRAKETLKAYDELVLDEKGDEAQKA